MFDRIAPFLLKATEATDKSPAALTTLERFGSWLEGSQGKAAVTVVGALGAAILFSVSLWQYAKSQKWQRVEFGLRQVDNLHTLEAARPARRWLEGIAAPSKPEDPRYGFTIDCDPTNTSPAALTGTFGKAESAQVALTPSDVANKLFRLTPDPEAHLPLDAFLYALHKVQVAVKAGCLSVPDVKELARYWLVQLTEGQQQNLRLALEYYQNRYFRGLLMLMSRAGYTVAIWPDVSFELGGWKLVPRWKRKAFAERFLKPPSGIHVWREYASTETSVVLTCAHCQKTTPLATLSHELQGEALFSEIDAATKKVACCERATPELVKGMDRIPSE